VSHPRRGVFLSSLSRRSARRTRRPRSELNWVVVIGGAVLIAAVAVALMLWTA